MPDHFIIDGLNVCLWRKPLSFPVLLKLACELQRTDQSFFCIFDAITRHRLSAEADQNAYAELLREYPGCFTEITGGIAADEFILSQAENQGACVISNDRYREYIERYAWLKGRTDRLIKGSVLRGALVVPALKLHVPVDSTSEIALAEWRTLRTPPTFPESSETGHPLSMRLDAENGFRRIYYADTMIDNNQLRGLLPIEAVQRLSGLGIQLTFSDGQAWLSTQYTTAKVRLGRRVLRPGEPLALQHGSNKIQIGDANLRATVSHLPEESTT